MNLLFIFFTFFHSAIQLYFFMSSPKKDATFQHTFLDFLLFIFLFFLNNNFAKYRYICYETFRYDLSHIMGLFFACYLAIFSLSSRRIFSNDFAQFFRVELTLFFLAQIQHIFSRSLFVLFLRSFFIIFGDNSASFNIIFISLIWHVLYICIQLGFSVIFPLYFYSLFAHFFRLFGVHSATFQPFFWRSIVGVGSILYTKHLFGGFT